MRSPYEQFLYEHKQRTVLLGSFRFYNPDQLAVMDEFEANDVCVTMPERGKIVEYAEDGYQILDVDFATDCGQRKRLQPTEIQELFFEAIDDAPFAYVVGGYAGELVTRELLYCAERQKPIFSDKTIAFSTTNEAAHHLLPDIYVAAPAIAASLMLQGEIPNQPWLQAITER